MPDEHRIGVSSPRFFLFSAGDSPTSKRTVPDAASSAKKPSKQQQKAAQGEKPAMGVTRSRTVDDIERARTFGSCESANLMLARAEEPVSAAQDAKPPSPVRRQPTKPAAHDSPGKASANGAPDSRRTEKVSCEGLSQLVCTCQGVFECSVRFLRL